MEESEKAWVLVSSAHPALLSDSGRLTQSCWLPCGHTLDGSLVQKVHRHSGATRLPPPARLSICPWAEGRGISEALGKGQAWLVWLSLVPLWVGSLWEGCWVEPT